VFLGEQEGFLALQERPSENPGVRVCVCMVSACLWECGKGV